MAAARGSDKLADRLGNRRTISEEVLEQILKASDREGVKLVDWWILGQPAVDGVFGTVQANLDTAANLVGSLLQVGTALALEVFPLGTPNPEVIQINFAGGEARGSRGSSR